MGETLKIADVIQYEGDNSTFIWKHPNVNFNSLTQLIVHESQEAIFMMNGQALGLYGPGRHTLETQNIFGLKNVVGGITGGKNPFHCEIYFINKTVQMGLKWGTDSKIRFIEPTLKFPLEIGASGEMNLMVSDSRKLLIKLVGTMAGIAWEEKGDFFTKSLQNCFRPLIATVIKTHLSSSIKQENINILEIDENLERLSSALRVKIIPGLEEYGLTVPQFYITNVVLPENDPNFKKLRSLYSLTLESTYGKAKAETEAEITIAQRKTEMERQTTETEITKRQTEREIIKTQAAAQQKVIMSQAEATKRAQEGYTYQQERGFDVAETVAQNEAVGQFTNLGVGLGTMAGVGGTVAGVVGTTMKDAVSPSSAEISCAGCSTKLPANAKFCHVCGKKTASAETVICPNCKTETLAGKFCSNCGGALVLACPKCNTEYPQGAKFCSVCGEKLS